MKLSSLRKSILLISSTRGNQTIVKKTIQKSWLANKIDIYGELSKFRLSSLVVFTTAAGFACAGAPFDLPTMAAACFGTGLCAASAGTFNQVLEIDRDASMKRTCNRPLPSGKCSVLEANAFGIATGAAGTGLLLAATNPVVAALGAANIFLYAVPYTLTKPRYELNTWIGSLVGAIPPVMGWAAATGGQVFAPAPMALASLLFLWQFPHFFALSWMHRQDYARGNFQMVAVNDPHGLRSADLIWEYSLYLTAFPLIVSATGLTSWMFAVEGTAANLYLLSLARTFRADQSNANARRIFLCSLWYLPLLLGAFVFHSANWNELKDTDKEGLPTNELTEAVMVTKEKMRGLCVHELLAYGKTSTTSVSTDTAGAENETSNHSSLCLKLKTDKVIDSASNLTKELVAANVTLAEERVEETETGVDHSDNTTQQ